MNPVNADVAGLLAVLDRSLTASAGEEDAPPAGLAAAVALNDLLTGQRLGWEDVLPPGSRLAKLCGCLGSGFAGERAAAYGHAVRLIRRRCSTWSDQLRLPESLRGRLPDPAAWPPDAVDDHLIGPGASVMPPPEADWIITIQQLSSRGIWPAGMDQARLAALEHNLVAGHDIAEEDAKWLRDLWWWAELHGLDTAAGD